MAEVNDDLARQLSERADLLDRTAHNGTEHECRELMHGTAQLIRRAFPAQSQPGVLGASDDGA